MATNNPASNPLNPAIHVAAGDVNGDGLDAVAHHAPTTLGDFDGDGDVDSADYAAAHAPNAAPPLGDFDGDGDVDGADYTAAHAGAAHRA